MGFNGSAIYAATALGAGIGGLAMSVGGPAALAPTAFAAALLAIAVAVLVRLEHHATND
jgi:predicted MFS family arabinose efflux permease